MSFITEIESNNWIDKLASISFSGKDSGLRTFNTLLKSVKSQEKKSKKALILDSAFKENLNFTDNEIQAAIHRFEKQSNSEYVSPAGFNNVQSFNGKDEPDNNNPYLSYYEVLKNVEPANYNNFQDSFSPIHIKEEPVWLSLIKAILGLIFPTFYNERFFTAEQGTDVHYLLRDYECEIREQILAELYVRNAIRILKNELSATFKFRNLISIQTHLQEVIYEYFDIVFSLKEDVVIKIKAVIEFIATPILLYKNEKKYIRNIPITC